MTTVAYKNGVMACDSACSDWGMLITKQKKIVRLPSGALLGEAGDCDSRQIHELLAKVKTPAQLPTRKELIATELDYAGLLVLPNGKIFRVGIYRPVDEENKFWHAECLEISESYHAIGSGEGHALTAMECGKSAREAVEIAIGRDMNSRGPVHTASLMQPPKKKRKKRK